MQLYTYQTNDSNSCPVCTLLPPNLSPSNEPEQQLALVIQTVVHVHVCRRVKGN